MSKIVVTFLAISGNCSSSTTRTLSVPTDPPQSSDITCLGERQR